MTGRERAAELLDRTTTTVAERAELADLVADAFVLAIVSMLRGDDLTDDARCEWTAFAFEIIAADWAEEVT